MFDRIIKKLRIMPQVADAPVSLRRLLLLQLFSVQQDFPFIRILAQEYLSQCGLSTGYRSGNACDLPRLRCKRDVPQHRLPVRIRECKPAYFQFTGLCARCSRLRVFLLHQRTDSLPGDLRLMYSVKQLGRAGRLHGQFYKAGKECGKCRNIPAAPSISQHIFLSEIQDETRHRPSK